MYFREFLDFCFSRRSLNWKSLQQPQVEIRRASITINRRRHSSLSSVIYKSGKLVIDACTETATTVQNCLLEAKHQNYIDRDCDSTYNEENMHAFLETLVWQVMKENSKLMRG